MPNQPQPQAEVVTHYRHSQIQRAIVDHSVPHFSHSDELPLSVMVRETGTLCRRLRVKTLEEVWYRDEALHVIVPKGFVSDLASIPRPLWCVLTPWDIAMESLFHDVLYRTQIVRRVVADAALLSMLEERKHPAAVRWTVYLGVRAGGRRAWRENKALLEAAKQKSEPTE